jgi:uncharacterized protein (DUF1330 family)
MGRHDSEIIGERPCKCGCGQMVQIKRWTLHPSKTKTQYIRGHQQWGNKRSWKTGEILQGGYIVVHSPNHPNKNISGYVRRARLIMEKYLGRYLTKNEIVHHINKNKNDDRIENLKLMTNSEHLSLHHKNTKQKRNSLGRFIKEK